MNSCFTPLEVELESGQMSRVGREFYLLLSNVAAGLRLSLPWRLDRRAFHVSLDQLVLLLLAGAGIQMLADYLQAGAAHGGADAVSRHGVPCGAIRAAGTVDLVCRGADRGPAGAAAGQCREHL